MADWSYWRMFKTITGDVKNPRPPLQIVQKCEALVKKVHSQKSPEVFLRKASTVPAEIRIQIWKETLTPCITSVIRVVNEGRWWEEEGVEFAGSCQLASRNRHVVKDVNYESRAEFLKTYEMLSGSTFKNPVFFNMNIDTLYFPTSWCFRRIPMEAESNIKKAQHIAIGFDKDFNLTDGVRSYRLENLDYFPILHSNCSRTCRNNEQEWVVYPDLLANVLSLSSLKSIKFIPHSEDKHIHTIILNKCQQDIRTGRRKPFEPWGMLDKDDLKPEAFIDIDLGATDVWEWGNMDKNKLAELMIRLKDDVDELRGPDVAPLQVSAAVIPRPPDRGLATRYKVEQLEIPGYDGRRYLTIVYGTYKSPYSDSFKDTRPYDRLM